MEPQSEAPSAPPGPRERKHPGMFHLFHRPARNSAAEQQAYAKSLADAGALRRARKQYNALVHSWPNAPEAVMAQETYARLLEDDHQYLEAFDEYQYLIDHFAGRFVFAPILERQFAIANHAMNRRRGAFLWFHGFSTRDAALPLFEQIVKNAPNWERTPESQFNIGAIHEQNGDHDLAVSAYEKVQFDYADSALAVGAAFRRAFCLYRLAKDAPRDEVSLRQALSALASFLRDYASDANAPMAEQYRDELSDRLAGMYYERAVFYDRLAGRPESALIAYRDFIKRFPISKQAMEAGERVQELEQRLGESAAN